MILNNHHLEDRSAAGHPVQKEGAHLSIDQSTTFGNSVDIESNAPTSPLISSALHPKNSLEHSLEGV